MLYTLIGPEVSEVLEIGAVACACACAIAGGVAGGVSGGVASGGVASGSCCGGVGLGLFVHRRTAKQGQK